MHADGYLKILCLNKHKEVFRIFKALNKNSVGSERQLSG